MNANKKCQSANKKCQSEKGLEGPNNQQKGLEGPNNLRCNISRTNVRYKNVILQNKTNCGKGYAFLFILYELANDWSLNET